MELRIKKGVGKHLIEYEGITIRGLIDNLKKSDLGLNFFISEKEDEGKMDKKYNILPVLLAAVLGAQTYCYADDGSNSVSTNIIEVKDIQLAKVEESGLRVYGGAKDNKLYYIAFAEADNCQDPIVELSNKQGVVTPSSQKNNSKDLGLLDVDLKGYKAWKIAISIIKENVAKEDAPIAYSVKFGSGTNCQPMTGTMPELQVSLDPAIEPDGSRTVILTNISSSGITITGIEENEYEGDDEKIITNKGVNPADFADKYIGIDGTLKFPLKPAESCFPGVTGKIVNDDGFYTNNGRYRFTIGYKINSEANTQSLEHKFEISVFRSCVREGSNRAGFTEKEMNIINAYRQANPEWLIEPANLCNVYLKNANEAKKEAEENIIQCKIELESAIKALEKSGGYSTAGVIGISMTAIVIEGIALLLLYNRYKPPRYHYHLN